MTDEVQVEKSRYSESLIMAILKQAEGGVPVPELCRGHGVSIALACRAFGVSETCYCYEHKLSDENALIADWLVRLTTNRRTWGFGLCF